MPPNDFQRGTSVRTLHLAVMLSVALTLPWHGSRLVIASADESKASAEAGYEVVSLSGHVTWFGEALAKRLGVNVVPEAAERTLVLETADGKLIPLIEDLRARAFRIDERLRAMEVELRVRRYHSTPALQILTVYQLLDGHKYEVDYWCDICSIPTYETGRCACCQQDNRLRKRLVEDRATP